MLSIVPSYKEQFLRLCRSFVCSMYVYSTHLWLFIIFFLINVAKFSFLLDECNS